MSRTSHHWRALPALLPCRCLSSSLHAAGFVFWWRSMFLNTHHTALPSLSPAASTLTGWTFNAVRTCFCAKCVRAFPSGISVLQHFQSSAHHVATVEALEVRRGKGFCGSTGEVKGGKACVEAHGRILQNVQYLVRQQGEVSRRGTKHYRSK